MAKTGIRYAVFAAVSNVLAYQDGHGGFYLITDQNAYTPENYKRWLWKKSANKYCQYTKMFHLSPVVSFNGSVSSGFTKDYGDDDVADMEPGAVAGTLSIELNNDSNTLYKLLFDIPGGSFYDVRYPWDTAVYDVVSEGDRITEINYDIDNTVPYVGVGAVGKSGNKWVAKWYPFVQFHHPNDDNATKQENVTFGHVTLEAEIFVNKFGIWKQQKSFDAFADAKAWLLTRLNPENFGEVTA